MTNRTEEKEYNEIIKTALRNGGFPETWLANKLGIPVSTLNSRLNKNKTITKSFFDDVMSVFKQYGIVPDDSERCKAIIETCNKCSGIMGSALDLLSHTVRDTVLDYELSDNDRTSLMTTTREIRSRINNVLCEVERYIGG